MMIGLYVLMDDYKMEQDSSVLSSKFNSEYLLNVICLFSVVSILGSINLHRLNSLVPFINMEKLEPSNAKLFAAYV